MTGNERVAVLEQRVKELEAQENRQRNWKMRVYGWIIGPAIALFLSGLTMYGQLQTQAFIIDDLQRKIERAEDRIEMILRSIK